MFSAVRLGLVDFEIIERPCCKPPRSITCAGDLPYAEARAVTVGSSSALVGPLSR